MSAVKPQEVAEGAGCRKQRTRRDADAVSERGAVDFRHWALGEPWPDEQFDLIVLSEIGYYLGAALALRWL